jgi:hypothetical protein
MKLTALGIAFIITSSIFYQLNLNYVGYGFGICAFIILMIAWVEFLLN